MFWVARACLGWMLSHPEGFVCNAQALAQGEMFTDVFQLRYEVKRFSIGVTGDAHGQACPQCAAVAADIAFFQRQAREVSLDEPMQFILIDIGVVWMGQTLERGGAQFFFGVAQHLTQHTIGRDPFTAHSQQGQASAGRIERQAIILFGKVDVFGATDFHQVRGLLRFIVERHA